MSWRDNLDDANARLATLEAAELELLSGKSITVIHGDGERVEFGRNVSLPDLRRSIYEVRAVIAGFTGVRPRGGAIIPRFGRH
jgi:hypothetical protein